MKRSRKFNEKTESVANAFGFSDEDAERISHNVTVIADNCKNPGEIFKGIIKCKEFSEKELFFALFAFGFMHCRARMTEDAEVEGIEMYA